MSRKYISTAIVGDAHASDILGVAVTKPFTITCSSDGYLKFWENASSDRKLAFDQFVDSLGLHHVTAFEDTVNSKHVLVVATVSFSGKCYLYSYDTTLTALTNLPDQLTNSKISYWACQLTKDPNGERNMLAVTTVTGRTEVFGLSFDEIPQLSYRGTAFANDTSFATCVDGNVIQGGLAVGHQNGCVYVYDLEYLKLIYSFDSFGLKSNVASSSLSTVRCVQFSPDGSLIAVARDSGPYGTVTLYDVKFGETVGSLTMPTHSAAVGIGSYAHNSWCLSVSFNDDGTLIASGGLDNKIRIWNVETKESEAVLIISRTDVADVDKMNEIDKASCVSLGFIDKGVNLAEGRNDGLVVVGFDRAVRWYREAGGI
ncbi:DEKNAAC105260 [Brettanomyces naardenensis]|uniref:DEKNAAC105260 n=1 Tax=Brettanomyces naardenensis TaxID=13370 RepID=A0A448YST5_BRENA|nr:DEKNAAC105260 [Brettanomyces naardenensis]